jgi:putative transposase
MRMSKRKMKLNLDTVLVSLGNKFTEDQMAYFKHFAREVLNARSPSVGSMYMAMCADSVRRQINGDPTFELCSESTFRRIVGAMRNSAQHEPQETTVAGQEVVPTDILALDAVKLDLHRVCTGLGFWECLHDDVRARLVAMRTIWATVAVDPCSQAFCAFRMTDRPPETSNFLVTLAVAVDDGDSAQPCFGRPDMVLVNDALAYTSHAFRAAVFGLTGKQPIYGNEQPMLCGRVERALYSLAKSRNATCAVDIGPIALLAEQWDPTKASSVTDQDILDLVGQLIIACHNGTPRRSLAGQTPIERWKGLLVQGRGSKPPLSKAESRDLFGVKLPRKIGDMGVNVLGLHYYSPELSTLRLSHQEIEIEVSIDQRDISVVSFLNPRDGFWHDAYPDVRGLEGVSMREWMETCEYLHQRNSEKVRAAFGKTIQEVLMQFRNAA